jgi:hypothetical protein
MSKEHFNPNPSVLASLTPEQQEQLLAWLDEFSPSEVVAKVAAPSPEGFGLKTYPNSVKRFYAKHRAAVYPHHSSAAEELLAAAANSSDFDQATAVALRQIAFELANSPGMSAKRFKIVSRWILKLRDQEHQARSLTVAQQNLALAEKRLALDREKFEYSAARAALNHLAGLTEIRLNPETDNEDKINQARALLFNRPISDLPK